MIKIAKRSLACLLTLSSLAPLCASAAAIQVLEQVIHPEQAINKKVELYGTVRLSTEYSDSDVSDREADADPLLSDGDVSVSSNTSTLGFRGEVGYRDGYTFLWQYEQQVDVDDTDAGDVLTTRDSFLGLRSPVGTFLVGRVNTPFKNMGVSYLGYFNTTVADSHAILGAPATGSGGRLDLMGSNSLNWKFRLGTVSVALQYAADQAGSVKSVDDNDRASYSAWVDWKPDRLQLSSAYIHYSDAFGTGALDAYRLFGKYDFGAFGLGAIYEDIDPDGYQALNREAYGLQATYDVVPRWTVAGQWNHAQQTAVGDDDSDQYSLGVFHALSDQVLLHAMYTITRNGDNAAYKGVDYSHGDKLATLAGRDPWSVSLGAQLKF
ncbi:porin [Alloalcanivorax mobilis]|uniref:porin n=1 Tax=Alloalcanivorax mobilis TaxID=2019569 RepID=UPI000B5B2A8C|nr:porin [Alloalcanivorax mobilis]ASK34213.1 hypothetical protein CEK62_07360 [Alcanivorax sp. N3-2A]|tara:strand:+ start:22257 stop:23393 length:1137 start_codon:yes stop_codon:yes gene_type:complete